MPFARFAVVLLTLLLLPKVAWAGSNTLGSASPRAIVLCTIVISLIEASAVSRLFGDSDLFLSAAIRMFAANVALFCFLFSICYLVTLPIHNPANGLAWPYKAALLAYVCNLLLKSAVIHSLASPQVTSRVRTTCVVLPSLTFALQFVSCLPAMEASLFQFRTVPASELPLPSGVQVYYRSPTEKHLWVLDLETGTKKLLIGKRTEARLHDHTETPGIRGLGLLDASLSKTGRIFDLIDIPREELPQPSLEPPSTHTKQTAPQLRAHDEPPPDWMCVCYGFYGLGHMGFHGYDHMKFFPRDPRIGSDMRVACGFPWSWWRFSNVSVLHGKLILCEIERKGIYLFDPSTRRMAFLARGSDPIPVLEEQASLPQAP